MAQSDIAITMPKTVDILAAYIWTGYDQGSQFEAGCRVWFEPSSATFQKRLTAIGRQNIARRGHYFRPWHLHPPPTFGASLMLGGVYLHKHNTGTPTGTAYQNDFYPLQQLRDIKPLHAPKGSLIVIDRDIFNIDNTKTFNAWDVEVIMIVQELAVLTIILRVMRRTLCRATQAVIVRIIRTLGYRKAL